jgi:hypothetical protein
MTDDLVTMRREQFRDGKFIGADEWSFHELDIFSLPQDDDFYCLKKSERHNDHFVVTRTKRLNIQSLEWRLEWQDDRVYIIFTNAGNTQRLVAPIFVDKVDDPQAVFGTDWSANFDFEGYQIADFKGVVLPHPDLDYGRPKETAFALGTLVGYGQSWRNYLVKADNQWVHVRDYEVDRQNLTMLPAPDYEPIPFDEVG